MRLENEFGLEADLERGLGDVHWRASLKEPSLRLRLPMCGITSLALARVMNQQGVEAYTVESTPDIDIEQNLKHVFVKASVDGREVLVDPTYSQFVDVAGLTPDYVMHGGADMFPEKKIAVFDPSEGGAVADSLADTIIHFREERELIDEVDFRQFRSEGMSRDEIADQLAEIWNPQHFEAFQPQDVETAEVAERLARYILPQHVRLVA